MRVIEKRNDYFLKYLLLTDRKVYDYYREHRRYKPKAINQYNYFVKAVSGIFYVIQRMIIESEGGVYIEGLGYFGCLKKPKKHRKRNSLTIRKTVYKPYFFPDTDFKKWSMSETFEHTMKKEIGLTPIHHKLHFGLCQSFRIAAGYSKNQKEQRPSRTNIYRPKI